MKKQPKKLRPFRAWLLSHGRSVYRAGRQRTICLSREWWDANLPGSDARITEVLCTPVAPKRRAKRKGKRK